MIPKKLQMILPLALFGLPLVLATLERAALCHPEPMGNGYVQGILGLSSIDNNVGTGVAYGVQAGYFFGGGDSNLGLGGFMRGANPSNNVTSFLMGGELLYRPDSTLPGLQLGFDFGSGKFSVGGVSGKTSFAYGVQGGWDFRLSPAYPFTAGLNLSFLFITPVDTTYLITTPTATMKVWF